MICDIDSYKKGGNIHLDVSFYDSAGKVQISQNILGPTYETFRICSPKDKDLVDGICNWDGRPVKKTNVDKLTKFDILNYLDSHHLRDSFLEFNWPDISVFDIETEVIDGFPNKELAREKVTVISYVNKDICLVLGWKEMTVSDIEKLKETVNSYLAKYGVWKVAYKKFNSEEDMLKAFFEILLKNSHMVTGWNLYGFDWPYLVKRAEVLGIDIRISSKSNKMNSTAERTPMHVGIMDYLPIYKKYDRTVKIKESNKLDFVAEQVLGVPKLKYEGTLQQLFENDFVKYSAYNAIDSILVLLIHNKIKTLLPPLMLANDNFLSIYKAISPVNLGDALLWRGFKKRNRVVADDFISKPKMSYEGAYVKDPIPGLYEALACFDFASLYPSTMRMCNISPESFVGKFEKDSDDIKKYMSDSNYIVTSSGAVFDSTTTSVLKEILDSLYAARRHYKDRYLDIKKFLGSYGIVL